KSGTGLQARAQFAGPSFEWLAALLSFCLAHPLLRRAALRPEVFRALAEYVRSPETPHKTELLPALAAMVRAHADFSREGPLELPLLGGLLEAALSRCDRAAAVMGLLPAAGTRKKGGGGGEEDDDGGGGTPVGLAAKVGALLHAPEPLLVMADLALAVGAAQRDMNAAWAGSAGSVRSGGFVNFIGGGGMAGRSRDGKVRLALPPFGSTGCRHDAVGRVPADASLEAMLSRILAPRAADGSMPPPPMSPTGTSAAAAATAAASPTAAGTGISRFSSFGSGTSGAGSTVTAATSTIASSSFDSVAATDTELVGDAEDEAALAALHEDMLAARAAALAPSLLPSSGATAAAAATHRWRPVPSWRSGMGEDGSGSVAAEGAATGAAAGAATAAAAGVDLWGPSLAVTQLSGATAIEFGNSVVRRKPVSLASGHGMLGTLRNDEAPLNLEYSQALRFMLETRTLLSALRNGWPLPSKSDSGIAEDGGHGGDDSGNDDGSAADGGYDDGGLCGPPASPRADAPPPLGSLVPAGPADTSAAAADVPDAATDATESPEDGMKIPEPAAASPAASSLWRCRRFSAPDESAWADELLCEAWLDAVGPATYRELPHPWCGVSGAAAGAAAAAAAAAGIEELLDFPGATGLRVILDPQSSLPSGSDAPMLTFTGSSGGDDGDDGSGSDSGGGGKTVVLRGPDEATWSKTLQFPKCKQLHYRFAFPESAAAAAAVAAARDDGSHSDGWGYRFVVVPDGPVWEERRLASQHPLPVDTTTAAAAAAAVSSSGVCFGEVSVPGATALRVVFDPRCRLPAGLILRLETSSTVATVATVATAAASSRVATTRPMLAEANATPTAAQVQDLPAICEPSEGEEDEDNYRDMPPRWRRTKKAEKAEREAVVRRNDTVVVGLGGGPGCWDALSLDGDTLRVTLERAPETLAPAVAAGATAEMEGPAAVTTEVAADSASGATVAAVPASGAAGVTSSQLALAQPAGPPVPTSQQAAAAAGEGTQDRNATVPAASANAAAATVAAAVIDAGAAPADAPAAAVPAMTDVWGNVEAPADAEVGAEAPWGFSLTVTAVDLGPVHRLRLYASKAHQGGVCVTAVDARAISTKSHRRNRSDGSGGGDAGDAGGDGGSAGDDGGGSGGGVPSTICDGGRKIGGGGDGTERDAGRPSLEACRDMMTAWPASLDDALLEWLGAVLPDAAAVASVCTGESGADGGTGAGANGGGGVRALRPGRRVARFRHKELAAAA
ncbi:unnamed protein product, partial [Phaeothamnion confervicola]